jgi:hypothetical protein
LLGRGLGAGWGEGFAGNPGFLGPRWRFHFRPERRSRAADGVRYPKDRSGSDVLPETLDHLLAGRQWLAHQGWGGNPRRAADHRLGDKALE